MKIEVRPNELVLQEIYRELFTGIEEFYKTKNPSRLFAFFYFFSSLSGYKRDIEGRDDTERVKYVLLKLGKIFRKLYMLPNTIVKKKTLADVWEKGDKDGG